MLKRGFPIVLVVFLVFVSLGDRFLPDPLGKASTKTRTALNQFVLGLLPDWEPKTDPYGRTEEALEQEEQGTSSN